MKPTAFAYLAPDTVEEALDALSEHGEVAAVLAGGQSLIPMMNLRISAPPVLIESCGSRSCSDPPRRRLDAAALDAISAGNAHSLLRHAPA